MSEASLLSDALRAICLTRDYVGERLLPPIPGWEWFDAGVKIAQAIPNDEWAIQFWLRVRAYTMTQPEHAPATNVESK